MVLKAAGFLASVGLGLVLTAAGLYFAAAPLAIAGLVTLAMSAILWGFGKYRKRDQIEDHPPTPQPSPSPRPASVFLKSEGNSIIDVEDSVSSADTFFDVKGTSKIASRGNLHAPPPDGAD